MAKRSNGRVRWLVAAVLCGLLFGLGLGAWQMRAKADDAAVAGATQDPDLYRGDTREAYQIARDHPDLLAQLDCYCGCEQNEGHKNLLDCYRTNHGASCDICMGEALTAAEMLKQGTPIDQIREALRARYGHRGA